MKKCCLVLISNSIFCYGTLFIRLISWAVLLYRRLFF
ncbi:MAG: sortase B protein-sorting domain-containing protein [Sphingobacteriales bacterium]|nr:MAG: sortase B protein-sorting domain-containing protein [Sphingobacteriales bacterium]